MVSVLLAIAGASLAPKVDPILEDLQHRAYLFFKNESNPDTGLTKDRASNSKPDDFHVASIASTGFALVAYAIGVERGWMERVDAKRRTLVTLRSINDLVEGEHGWLYHFVDWRTGKREWKSEASTIDTAILLAGVLASRQYWRDPEIDRLADRFAKRIDWQWALTDGGAKPDEKL
ncbi:MAG: hypothetical protein LDL56_11280, partial [Armatimonadetes bacterium]|nr:hypothetical protein [Armatimonadota bacterium]